MKKFKSLLVIAGLCVGLLSGCGKESNTNTTVPTTAQSDVLSINCLSVGKADAIIIQQGEHAVLIDAGESNDGSAVVSALKNQGISNLDAFIITHYDQDHVGGAQKVIQNMEIGRIICPDYEGDNAEYGAFVRAVKNKEVEKMDEKDTTTIQIGESNMTLYAATDKVDIMDTKDEFDNNMSLVAKLIYNNNSFLLTGDIEKKRIKQMLASDIDWSCDWIKIPHHGRYQKFVKKLLEAATPEYAVISTSSDEPPVEKLEAALQEANITYYGTMEKNVVTYSDGEKIWIE